MQVAQFNEDTHMAIEPTFADQIVNLSVSNGMVRIDLGIVENAGEGEDGKRKKRAQVTQRVVMPLDGFVRSFAMQQKLVGQPNERVKKAKAAKAPAETA